MVEKELKGKGYDLFFGIMIGITGNFLVASVVEMARSVFNKESSMVLDYWVFMFVISWIVTLQVLKVALKKYAIQKRTLEMFDISIIAILGAGIFVFGYGAENLIIIGIGGLMICLGFLILAFRQREFRRKSHTE